MDFSPSGSQTNFQPDTVSNLPQRVPLELTQHSVRKQESQRSGEFEAIMSSQACTAALSRINSTNQEGKENDTLIEENYHMEVSPAESAEEIIHYVSVKRVQDLESLTCTHMN